MYHVLLKRNAQQEEICVMMNWPEAGDIWKAWKALWLQQEYEIEYHLTMGDFPSRFDILVMDNKVNHKEVTIDDFRGLVLDIGLSRYEVLEATDDFEACLNKAISCAEKKPDAKTNNLDELKLLQSNRSAWDEWKKANGNYVVYVSEED